MIGLATRSAKGSSRVLATVAAILFAACCFLLAATSHAEVFQICDVTTEAKRFGGEDAPVWARRACEAQDSIFKTWEAKLHKLDIGQQDLTVATNAGDWKTYREKWAELLPVAKEIHATALAHRDAAGAAPVLSLYRSDLSMFSQNAGLGAASNLDDFSAHILSALEGPRPAAAATAGIGVMQQSMTRGIELARGLASVETDKIVSEHRAQMEHKAAERRDKRSGDTLGGYFGGFGQRISAVWIPFFTVLFGLMLAAFVLAGKFRQNPVTWASVAAIAYLLPGLAMAVAFVLLPFLPAWVLIASTLVGTYVMYARGGRICGALAAHLPQGSALGRRLRFFGALLDNLRLGLQGSGATATGASALPGAQLATHGSARWGAVAEIRQAGHLVMPGQPAGFALGRVSNPPPGLDARFRFTGHVVTVAPTGSGKGIGAVIPNLLDYPGSALVLDVKGENAAVTARARRAIGQAVHVIDPFAVHGSDGAAFNVLDRLDPGHPDCVSESAILADALVIAEGKGGDSVHFDESAKNFLQGLMLHIAGLEEGQRRNLGELRRLLTAGEAELFELLATMAVQEAAAFGLPARAATTLMGMADKERGSVLSTARRNTSFLDDPRIAAALSRSDFNLSDIKTKAMTIYLVMPANRMGPNARFLRLFISSVIAAITSSSVQPAHRVAFLLDEFGQLGYLRQIEDAVSLMRGYGLAFWVFIQDLSQLKGSYPKWQTFLANSAKSFFGTDDYDTAKYISDSLGKATIEFETESSGQSKGTGLSGKGSSMNLGRNQGISQQFAGRELLTPDEVMRLGPERPIVLIQGEYPYLLNRLNYLVDPEYAGRFDANPYHG